MKIYIQAKSKKQINERLASGEDIIGIEYNMFNPNGYMTEHKLKDLPSGTTVAVFSEYQHDGLFSNPISKAWGSWNPIKNKLS